VTGLECPWQVRGTTFVASVNPQNVRPCNTWPGEAKVRVGIIYIPVVIAESCNATCECRLLSSKAKDGGQAIRGALQDESRQIVKIIKGEKRML
jgi:hypothetical protein